MTIQIPLASKAGAFLTAERGARYSHGTWFVWEDKSGNFNGEKATLENLSLALECVKPESKVWDIGGGGRHSMVFHRYGASILSLWKRNAEIGVLV